MDAGRLRRGEAIAGIAGIVLLAVMFLDWYGTTVAVGTGVELPAGFNAWRAFAITDLLLVVVALCGIALALLQMTQRAPALPVAASVITATLGIAGTLLVLYRILNQPGPNEFIDVKLGAWLGLLAIVAVAVGGWLSMADDGSGDGDPRAGLVERRPAPPPGPPDS